MIKLLLFGIDVFNCFKDKEGMFNKEVKEDINGLMGLFEASQLCIEGENTLVEAGDFSRQLLNEWMSHLDYNQAKVVGNTLRHPYHRSLARFMAKNFFDNIQGTSGWFNDFQQLAKMDFNVVQSKYRKEIVQISKFHNNLTTVVFYC